MELFFILFHISNQEVIILYVLLNLLSTWVHKQSQNIPALVFRVQFNMATFGCVWELLIWFHNQLCQMSSEISRKRRGGLLMSFLILSFLISSWWMGSYSSLLFFNLIQYSFVPIKLSCSLISCCNLLRFLLQDSWPLQ